MMLPLYLLPMVAVLASAISESAKDVVDDVDLLINPADNGNMHIDADEEGNVEKRRARNPYSWMVNPRKRGRNPYSWMSAYAPQHQKTSSSNNNYGYGEDLFVRRYRPFSPFVSKRQLHQIDSEPFEAADEWPLFGGYGSSSRGLRNPYSWMSKK